MKKTLIALALMLSCNSSYGSSFDNYACKLIGTVTEAPEKTSVWGDQTGLIGTTRMISDLIYATSNTRAEELFALKYSITATQDPLIVTTAPNQSVLHGLVVTGFNFHCLSTQN